MSDPVIQTENLTKRYGRATAVDHISFSVGRGEIFGLLGPNGAGKTTTILMLLGLSDISEGTARVLGRDPAREPLSVKRQVGYLPDAVGFYDYLERRRQSALHGAAHRHPARGTRRAHPQGLAPGGTRRRGGSAGRDLFARHAPASGARRDPDEGGADRHPGRADLGPRSAGHRRAAGDDPRTQARRRHGVAVVASAAAGAERLRPRGAVPVGPHRAHGHGRRAGPAGAGRRLRGRDRGAGRRSRPRLACIPGVSAVEKSRARRAHQAARRPRRAGGSRGRGHRGRRQPHLSVDRGSDPRSHLCAAFPGHGRGRASPCGVKDRRCTASARSLSRSWPTI